MINSNLVKYVLQFSSDDICLEFIFNRKYGNPCTCPRCNKTAKFYKIKNRKSYACGSCGLHINPLSGTIMSDTKIPLSDWFAMFFLTAKSISGQSSPDIARFLDINQNSAFYIQKKIREVMIDKELLGDAEVVEIDESLTGGKQRLDQNRSIINQYNMFGLKERYGRLRLFWTPDKSKKTLQSIILKTVKLGCTIYTDKAGMYNDLAMLGYRHKAIKKKVKINGKVRKIHKRGRVCTNQIENVWKVIQQILYGVHNRVSEKYLQLYLNEYSFKASRQGDHHKVLEDLIDRALRIK